MQPAAPNWPLLGAIRFALALIVVFCHLSYFDRSNMLTRLTTAVGGFACVGAFLVISGFSIAHSIRKGTEGFYGRRIDRIFPVYFVCLVISFLPIAVSSIDNEFGAWLLGQSPSLRDVIALTLAIPSIGGNGMPSFGPAWSLGIEVVFYACAPFLARLSRTAFAWVFGAAILFHAIQSTGWPVSGAPHEQRGLWPVLSCAVWWLWGWYLAHQDNARLSTRSVLTLIAIPCVFALNPHRYDYADLILKGDAAPIVMTLTCVACAYGHHLVLSEKMKAVCVYLGDISYPLYLVHMPIYFLLAVTGHFSPLFVWLYPLFAIVAAIALLHGVDYPYRALANRRLAFSRRSNETLPKTALQ